MIFRLPFLASLFMALCGFTNSAAAAVETYRVNLDPLIDRAAGHSTQFAVDVLHRLDSESSGSWSSDGDNVVWDYAIKIPTALSVGFHANRLLLPQKGTLTVVGGGRQFTVRGSDLHRADFWSRPVQGDQLAIHISVPRQLRHQTLLQIAAFQAGYKSLASGVPDHPHYRALKSLAANASSTCVENYACDASAATQSQAYASVALVISNKIICSGTLLNDVPQDGIPYVLAARHCENGDDGGGDPAAAASVQVYWNSITPCGQNLLTIFDESSQVQGGATTVVEQQDQWLMRLDSQPYFQDAYFAGWDASGAALVGGYTIDYAGGNSQQYATFSGTAITEDFTAVQLSVGYNTTYWGVVNSLGSVDHGASGSGLFNKDNLLVGSASRAVAGQCPVNPPPAPSKDSVSALFSRLASTWTSTADASSSTGSITLASVLDPTNTGATTSPGIAGFPPTTSLYVSQTAAQTGSTVNLVINTTAGAVCTAMGGVPGDGWTGVLSTGQYLAVTESNPAVVTYGVTCTIGARSSAAQVQVTWSVAPPTLTFYDQNLQLYVGVANILVWRSNNPSCIATGGSPGDGWSGSLGASGQVNVTENQPGTYDYTLTCGTGSQAISQTLTLTFVLPTASMQLYSLAGLRLGQGIAFNWHGSGDCTASGGAAGDNWAGALSGNFGSAYLTEQTAGTYVYKISCGPPAVAATAEVTYIFSGAPPSATLMAPQPSYVIDLSVPQLPNVLTWTSNVEPCEIDYTGPVGGTDVSGFPPQGTDTQPQWIAGTYTYVLICGSGSVQTTSSTTIQWQQQPNPQVTLTTENGSEFMLSGGYLAWSTNVLPCIGSGGGAGDGWNGPRPYYGGPGNTSASLISEASAGTYNFSITCGVGATASASATAIFNNVGGSVLTLTPGGTISVFENQPVYLTWNSAVGPCTGYGGTAGDGWSGPQPQKGTLGVVEPLGFDAPLTLVCGTGTAAVEAQTTVWVYAPATQIYIGFGSSLSRNVVGRSVTLNWNSLQAASCTATNGATGDGWSGTLPWYGSMTVVESQPGSVSYGLTCQNGPLSANQQVTVFWDAQPAVSLVASTQNAVLGTAFTLTWSSTSSFQCNASEDSGASIAFAGPQPTSGSMSIQESSGTQHTYAMTCSNNYGNDIQAQTVVNFTASSGGGSGSGSSGGSGSASSSGHSGGGDLDPASIGLLAILTTMRGAWRRLRFSRPKRRSKAMMSGAT